MNKVKIIGMKRSTLAVVSNIMTARANVILVAPESMAVAPIMQKNELLMVLGSGFPLWAG